MTESAMFRDNVYKTIIYNHPSRKNHNEATVVVRND
jgi:hypothetical protein